MRAGNLLSCQLPWWMIPRCAIVWIFTLIQAHYTQAHISAQWIAARKDTHKLPPRWGREQGLPKEFGRLRLQSVFLFSCDIFSIFCLALFRLRIIIIYRMFIFSSPFSSCMVDSQWHNKTDRNNTTVLLLAHLLCAKWKCRWSHSAHSTFMWTQI